jgi:putative effector of murein hydrolase
MAIGSARMNEVDSTKGTISKLVTLINGITLFLYLDILILKTLGFDINYINS